MPPEDHGPDPQPPEGSGPNRDASPNSGAPLTPASILPPFSHNPISARVPERVGRGVFSTGVIVQEGPGEFVLDFVQSLTRPPQIAARVVLTPGVMQALVVSLTENVEKYTQAFGPPPAMPKPPPPLRRPTTQELYENFKLPEDQWSGTYANSVLIGHDPAEFFLDFITRFYPTAAVACRVYLAAPQVLRVLEALASSVQQYQRRNSPPSAPPPQSLPPPQQP